MRLSRNEYRIILRFLFKMFLYRDWDNVHKRVTDGMVHLTTEPNCGFTVCGQWRSEVKYIVERNRVTCPYCYDNSK